MTEKWHNTAEDSVEEEHQDQPVEEPSEADLKVLDKEVEEDVPVSEEETSEKVDEVTKDSFLGKGVDSMDKYDKLTKKEQEQYGI